MAMPKFCKLNWNGFGKIYKGQLHTTGEKVPVSEIAYKVSRHNECHRPEKPQYYFAELGIRHRSKALLKSMGYRIFYNRKEGSWRVLKP